MVPFFCLAIQSASFIQYALSLSRAKLFREGEEGGRNSPPGFQSRGWRDPRKGMHQYTLLDRNLSRDRVLLDVRFLRID